MGLSPHQSHGALLQRLERSGLLFWCSFHNRCKHAMSCCTLLPVSGIGILHAWHDYEPQGCEVLPLCLPNSSSVTRAALHACME